MKIYFAGSIKGGREDKDLYAQIIGLLRNYGAVLTEHIGDKNLSDGGEDFLPDYIYKRDMQWLREADVLVAEVTTPSLGVGYEIGKFEDRGKPILCLFRKESGRALSSMIAGNDNITVEKYKTIEDIASIFQKFFKSSLLC